MLCWLLDFLGDDFEFDTSKSNKRPLGVFKQQMAERKEKKKRRTKGYDWQQLQVDAEQAQSRIYVNRVNDAHIIAEL